LRKRKKRRYNRIGVCYRGGKDRYRRGRVFYRRDMGHYRSIGNIHKRKPPPQILLENTYKSSRNLSHNLA